MPINHQFLKFHIFWEVNVYTDTVAIKYLGQNGIGIQNLNIYRSLNNGINFELLNTINNPTFPLPILMMM